MTTDLCTEDVVVCIASPQIIPTSGGVVGGVSGGSTRVAASSAAVELGRRLLLAARAGNTALVLDLMAKGAPFTTDWLGTSPLHLAATNNHVETCAVLLRAGVSRDARTKVERTPLHLAAYAGHDAVLALLLDHGAAVDCRDMLRMTPLHWAAERGHAAAARALLARGCGAAPRNKFGKTPRALAAARGHAELAALLAAAEQRQRDAELRLPRVSAEEPAPRRKAAVREEPAEPELDFATIRVQEMKPNARTKIQQETPPKPDIKTETNNNAASDSRAAALLRRHGITLLPTDDSSTVLNALQCGRTVVLSDAGKLMLKESSTPQVVSAAPAPPTPTMSTAGAQSPSKGLKLFALNKLILPKVNKNLGNMQVKLVPLSGTGAAPAAGPAPGPGPAPGAASAPGPAPRARRRAGTPLSIVVHNHNNYKQVLLSNANQGDNQPSEQQSESPTSTDTDDKESLRAQLQAARKAIAALTAELASCKARLAQFERQT